MKNRNAKGDGESKREINDRKVSEEVFVVLCFVVTENGVREKIGRL